jgi:hypothetical protein
LWILRAAGDPFSSPVQLKSPGNGGHEPCLCNDQPTGGWGGTVKGKWSWCPEGRGDAYWKLVKCEAVGEQEQRLATDSVEDLPKPLAKFEQILGKMKRKMNTHEAPKDEHTAKLRKWNTKGKHIHEASAARAEGRKDADLDEDLPSTNYRVSVVLLAGVVILFALACTTYKLCLSTRHISQPADDSRAPLRDDGDFSDFEGLETSSGLAAKLRATFSNFSGRPARELKMTRSGSGREMTCFRLSTDVSFRLEPLASAPDFEDVSI